MRLLERCCSCGMVLIRFRFAVWLSIDKQSMHSFAFGASKTKQTYVQHLIAVLLPGDKHVFSVRCVGTESAMTR